jgi:hypothetical protein
MRSTFWVAGLLLASSSAAPAPRLAKISGQRFVLASTGADLVMAGPNVVVKGPPYLPDVSGTTVCADNTDGACAATGTCSSCTTFNQADIDHIKSYGWNTIRLGVAWAGAQPRDEDALDPAFVARLHALLNLTDANGIHVMLDNHGDMVGSAGCGNGVPMWFSQKASPDLIGKPLKTGLPYSLIGSLEVAKVGGYGVCGADNETAWAEHAGDPNYNLLNRCCQAMNSPNPAGLGYTTVSQAAMDYMVTDGAGRADFVRYWRLLAEAVVDHPSAFAAELMNEPMTIKRDKYYETWRACAEAINAVVPDMSVALCDVGEGAVLPSWVSLIDGGVDISADTVEWIKKSGTLFYAWHWYGTPKKAADAVTNVQELGKKWDIPTFATEFFSCDAWLAAKAAGISHTYWHYSAYCNTGPNFGNRKVPDDTFGACILGWGGGSNGTRWENCS